MPKSWLVFYAALFASVSVSVVTAEIVTGGVNPMHGVNMLLTAGNAAFYFLVVQIAGYQGRYLQTLTAILGVDAIITLVYLGGFTVVSRFFDPLTTLTFVWAVTGWSVAVEGHIISRAIDRPWAIGIAIAVVSYALLLMAYQQLAKLP